MSCEESWALLRRKLNFKGNDYHCDPINIRHVARWAHLHFGSMIYELVLKRPY